MAKPVKSDAGPQSRHPLPWIELTFYRAVHISVVVYITWLVYVASKKYDGLLNVHDFEPGLFNYEKDISNYEWNFFYHWFWKITPFYIGHIAISKIVAWNFQKYKRLANLTFSILTLVFLMGWRVVALFIAHCILMYIVSLTRSKYLVWIVSLGLLSTLNFRVTYSWMRSLTNQDKEEREFYLLVFTLALAEIRYTSFCLEKCSQPVQSVEASVQPRQQPEEATGSPGEQPVAPDGASTGNADIVTQSRQDVCQYGLLDLLFYVFYFPLFFTGPIMTYDVFHKQMNQKSAVWNSEKTKSIILGFSRVLLWTVVNNIILHFLYFNAIQHNLTVMNDADLWTLAGIGYWNGQFFMTKYVVLFGYPASVAKVDNLEPVDIPKCVSYIYTYSDMWKYFDRGMYSFMKRYIFVPVGGSRSGIGRQFLGSLLCFIFVYIWHGSEYYVFLWTVFNFIGVSVEVIAKLVLETKVVHKFETEVMSPSSVRRLHGMLTVPFFLMSAITAFCFFGGSMIGYIFYERVVFGSLKSWLTVVGILYCCIESSMEINRRDQTRRHKEKQN